MKIFLYTCYLLIPMLMLMSWTAAQGANAEDNYQAAIDAISPLTADQIRALRKRIDQAKRAAAASPGTSSTPIYSVQTVDLSPGAMPPTVRVSHLGAAVTFIDSTGAPWDILEVNNMAQHRFEVLKPVASVPTITITALGDYVEGDASVFLKNLPFPIVVKMVAGQPETDYRLDIRVPRRGPNAAEPIRAADAIDLPKASMQSLLDGVDTPGAKPIVIQNAKNAKSSKSSESSKNIRHDSAGIKAWGLGERIILRTTLFLNHPAYYSALAAADGTKVYEIPRTPVITVSENGTLRNIFLDLD